MKKLIIILIGLMIAGGINAQNHLVLKGPKAKNSRSFEKRKNIKMVTRTVPVDLKGPRAKNYTRRGIRPGERYTYVTSSPRIHLKGPAAKHYRPKINAFNSDVFRKRSSEE